MTFVRSTSSRGDLLCARTFLRHNTNRSAAIACCCGGCVRVRTDFCAHIHSILATMDFMQTQHNPAELFLATTVASDVRSMPNGEVISTQRMRTEAMACVCLCWDDNSETKPYWCDLLAVQTAMLYVVDFIDWLTDKAPPNRQLAGATRKKTPTTISAESEIYQMKRSRNEIAIDMTQSWQPLSTVQSIQMYTWQVWRLR